MKTFLAKVKRTFSVTRFIHLLSRKQKLFIQTGAILYKVQISIIIDTLMLVYAYLYIIFNSKIFIESTLQLQVNIPRACVEIIVIKYKFTILLHIIQCDNVWSYG